MDWLWTESKSSSSSSLLSVSVAFPNFSFSHQSSLWQIFRICLSAGSCCNPALGRLHPQWDVAYLMQLVLSWSYMPHIFIWGPVVCYRDSLTSALLCARVWKCVMSSDPDETQSSRPFGKQPYTLTPCFPLKSYRWVKLRVAIHAVTGSMALACLFRTEGFQCVTVWFVCLVH